MARKRSTSQSGTDTSSARRSTSGTSRRHEPEPLLREDELSSLIDTALSIAQKSLGIDRLGSLAPTVLAVAERYARREPARAALIGLTVAGLWLLGRVFLQKSDGSPLGLGSEAAPGDDDLDNADIKVRDDA